MSEPRIINEPLTATAPVPVPSPAAMPRRPVFDRQAWEAAVLDSGLGREQRLVAFVLAHHADQFGQLPPGGPQTSSRLGAQTHIGAKNARLVLLDLEGAGFIRRPAVNAWRRAGESRPITLALPPAAGVPAAVRAEPEHPGSLSASR